MHIKNDNAVSEVIGIVLVVGIVTFAIAVVLFWAIPYMDDQKANVIGDSAEIQLSTVNNLLNDVVYQGKNSSRSVNFVTDKGELHLNSKGDRFIVFYSVNKTFNFTVLDFDDNIEDNFQIEILDRTTNNSQDKVSVFIEYLYDDSLPIEDVFIGGTGINPINVNSNNDLIKAIKIELYAKSFIGPPRDKDLVGLIWLFNVGNILFKTSSGSMVAEIIAENGGIIRGNGDSSFLVDKPNLIQKDNLFVTNMIQFKPRHESSFGGNAVRYRILFINNETNILENKIYVPNEIRFQVYGEYSDAWIHHFKSELNCAEFTDPGLDEPFYYIKKEFLSDNDVSPPGGYQSQYNCIYFSLIQTEIEIDVDVIG